MTSLRLALFVALSLSAAANAFAQNAPVTTSRAVIESVAPGGASLAVKQGDGPALSRLNSPRGICRL